MEVARYIKGKSNIKIRINTNGLADLIWAPASVVIKALSVFCFKKTAKIASARNLLGLVPASLISVFGYYLYEGFITGNFLEPLFCIHLNIIQAVLSSALFIFLAYTSDKMGLKEKIL